MQTTFRVSPNEFTSELVEKIKALLGSQSEIEIIIKEKCESNVPGISFDEACQKVTFASNAYEQGSELFSSSDVLNHVIK